MMTQDARSVRLRLARVLLAGRGLAGRGLAGLGLAGLGLAAGLLAAGLAAPAGAQQPAGQPAPSGTLRIVLANPLASLDPVVSTAAFIRNHGFMVYDQLFGLDSKGEARPQMVERHEVSADGTTHRFILREGLIWHDGQPVRAADAVASIRRWGQRDIAGRALLRAVAAIEVENERTFVIRLGRPFGLVTEALARPTASALFMMPERIASTPANVAFTDATGSGPFIFQRDQFSPGERAVYVRNPAYRPRPEPADGLAGGKLALLERIEWLGITDPATVAAAIQAGEVDFVEQPSPDVQPILARNRNIRLFALNPIGSMIWLRPNHRQPPFDHPAARQALLYLVNQQENLQAVGIAPSEQVPFCPAYFLCGTPLESSAGARGLRAIDVEKAKALLREAGYDGRRVVFLNAADAPVNNAVTLTMAQNMRQAGLNVDVATTDWATLSQRRNRQEPIEQGGWNLFVTVANVLDAQNPLVNVYLGSPCQGGLAGWPCDERLEQLRASWWEEGDPAKRRAILEQVHAQAYESLPYINAGQFRTLAAHRTNIHGLGETIIPVFWGVTKR